MSEESQIEQGSSSFQAGQTIMTEFRVEKEMTHDEARELIRANTPSSLTFQAISLGETAGAQEESA